MSVFMQKKYMSLEAYTPGEQPQDMQYIKLNTNESPYPPSPGVLEAVKSEAGRLQLYPDPECRILKERLAEANGISPENVFVSNGSDETLSFAFMAFCGEEGVAFPSISYGFYQVYADLYGVKKHIIPLSPDFSINPESYFGLNKTIVIANPNAPTGLTLAPKEVEQIISKNPASLVIIDEAYVAFGAETCLPLISKYENLLIVRTFSKSHSMAGARLGFAAAHPAVIADLEKIKYSTNPYNVNRLTQYAGIAALKDEDYYRANCLEVAKTREYTKKELIKRGFLPTASAANFLFAMHPSYGGKVLYEGLKQKGVLVRHFKGIDDYLRITIGTRGQSDALLQAIDSILNREEEHENSTN